MAFCIKCGTNVGDSLFCGNCGAKITYNEKKHNILDNANESEQSANAYRVKVHSKKKAEPESISNEQNFFASDPLPEAQPEPQYNEIPESNIYSGQKEPSFYSQEPTDIFSNTNRSKVKPRRITEESSNSDYKANDKKQNVNLRVKGKAAPKAHAKKAVITIICIISAVAVIASAVAIGIYIKPKADLYVIANAVAKTVFQSGSYNFNIEGKHSEYDYIDGEDYSYFCPENFNGCVIWGENVADSYIYFYSDDDDGLRYVIKFENGHWKYSYDGYKFSDVEEKETENYPLTAEEAQSITIDENGLEKVINKIYIPFANSEFVKYWDSSIDSLTYRQIINNLKDMLLDDYFNENAVSINNKSKVDGGTEYSLSINVDKFIKSCWEYLKNTDIYTTMLDNSENRNEFDKEMNEYFDDFDEYFNTLVTLDIVIDDDGYISDLSYSSGYINDGSVDFDDKEYEVEIYNFGQAVKQK
jgi:hypothetical protein